MKTVNAAATGAKIKQTIKNKGMKVSALAEMLSVTPQAMHKWFSGTALPSVNHLYILSGVLDCTIESLIVPLN